MYGLSLMQGRSRRVQSSLLTLPLAAILLWLGYHQIDARF